MMEMFQIYKTPSFFLKWICKNGSLDSAQRTLKGIFCHFAILKHIMFYDFGSAAILMK